MTLGLLIMAAVFFVLFVERYVRSRRRRLFITDIVQTVRAFAGSGAGREGRITDVQTAEEKAAASVLNQAMDSVLKQITRLSEERDVLTHILETMTTGVIYVSTNGRIERMNQAAEQMFLRPIADVLGTDHWTVIHNYELGAAIDNALLFGHKWSSEMNLRKGLTVSVQVIPIPLDAPAGAGPRQIYTALLLCNDVSQWRRIEQMRSDFVANVSHELKTPITAIQGFAETLLDGEKDAQIQTEFLRVIHDESIRMKNLVADLLTLTRLESGNGGLSFSKVNLQEVVAASVRVIEPIAQAAQVVVENTVTADLVVWGAEEQLKQVVLNLVTNAIHYTPLGGVVTVFAESYVDRVKIHVADTGIGIPKEHQERVFERFYRVDRDRSRATGGTGLGLAIAKHIVQTHGGEIGVDSEPGLGSDFWFTVSRLQGLPTETPDKV
ncbi:sensor histidine kinase [Alicyclobacillus ferrooxydans]|uniref:histidine kinase n=1 Tax=Alicyclobacillus ferrooxydans TaxID=471514 RepID=A0A0P9GNX6_9BACL|nr:ATP-binding protein [Alicyclobacillus ferrooxydans]KPV42252.1 hypothetical protein AN477_18230 [Alicyclobacillus ferrooxydans]